MPVPSGAVSERYVFQHQVSPSKMLARGWPFSRTNIGRDRTLTKTPKPQNRSKHRVQATYSQTPLEYRGRGAGRGLFGQTRDLKITGYLCREGVVGVSCTSMTESRNPGKCGNEPRDAGGSLGIIALSCFTSTPTLYRGSHDQVGIKEFSQQFNL